MRHPTGQAIVLPARHNRRFPPPPPPGSARASNALAPIRLRLNDVWAFGAVLLGAAALAALRIDIPDGMAGFALLLFGSLGVALGRLSIVASAGADNRTRAQIATKSAGAGLVQPIDAVSADAVVSALIEDNRRMRDRLASVSDQLEASRLQASRLRSAIARIERAGMRDAVTRIGNRRYFDAALAEELERARRTGDSFSLALADLDRFKRVNDRFGHQAGDHLLRLFAEILTQNARGTDRVARYGGEEFALLLPGARLADATAAAERIRKALAAKPWTLAPAGEPVGAITGSFGVAELRAGETAAGLIRRADDRLYEAKARGRNCVVGDASPCARDSRNRRSA